MRFKLSNAITLTQQHSDTENQGIDAADTSRVVSTFFKVLAKLTPVEVASVISQGLTRAVDSKNYPSKRK